MNQLSIFNFQNRYQRVFAFLKSVHSRIDLYIHFLQSFPAYNCNHEYKFLSYNFNCTGFNCFQTKSIYIQNTPNIPLDAFFVMVISKYFLGAEYRK